MLLLVSEETTTRPRTIGRLYHWKWWWLYSIRCSSGRSLLLLAPLVLSHRQHTERSEAPFWLVQLCCCCCSCHRCSRTRWGENDHRGAVDIVAEAMAIGHCEAAIVPPVASSGAWYYGGELLLLRRRLLQLYEILVNYRVKNLANN